MNKFLIGVMVVTAFITVTALATGDRYTISREEIDQELANFNHKAVAKPSESPSQKMELRSLNNGEVPRESR